MKDKTKAKVDRIFDNVACKKRTDMQRSYLRDHFFYGGRDVMESLIDRAGRLPGMLRDMYNPKLGRHLLSPNI